MYRWIQAGLLDQPIETIQATYGPRPPRRTRLEAFKPLIQARLTEYPALSGIRLFSECRAAGYDGGITQLRAYIQTLRPAPDPLVRFETPPGHQAQVDFAHCRFPWGVRYALLAVLGYSRLLWVQFYPRQDLRTLMLGLETCFTAWGGVPQEVLFDQMRSVVTRDERLSGGGLRQNLEFLRFARHHHFRVRVCRPYRAKTKGKVERPIRYLRENFLYGRMFLSDADLNAQVLDWLTMVANPRDHGTTHVPPIDRFRADEQRALQPLAARPYRSLVLPPTQRGAADRAAVVPVVPVERRSLAAYAQLTAAGGEP
jgi:transposase